MSVQTSQLLATNKENLVGKTKSLIRPLTQEINLECMVNKKNLSSKETQTDFDKNISEDDLTNTDGTSGKYWRTLYERLQANMKETIKENEKLYKTIEKLKEQKALYAQMLDEANSFVEVFKEEILNKCNDDDTGIDVNDVSTADDTTDNDNSVLSNNDN